MAFNPFTSFRKHQKFWMAFLTLMAMVTFVLCTGVGGDLSDRLLMLFGGSGGGTLAKIEGRNITYKELEDLKQQRMLAEKYTRRAIEIHEQNLSEYVKRKDIPEEERSKVLPIVRGLRDDLAARLQKKNYWDTGTKLEDLVDFLMWKKVADRLGIYLRDDSVKEMFREEILAHSTNRYAFYLDRHDQQAFHDAASGFNRGASPRMLIDALRDEFRVRLAKICVAEEQLHQYARSRGNEHLKLFLPREVRSPLTPMEMWDFYKENRAERTIGMVPVAAQDFVKLVATPDAKELEAFYRERRQLPSDPSAERDGLQTRQMLKVEYLMGDPQKPFYQVPAKAVVLNQLYPAVWAPTGSLLGTAVRYGAVPELLDMQVNERLKKQGKTYLTAELADSKFSSKLFEKSAKPTSMGVALMLAALSEPNPTAAAGYYTAVSWKTFEIANQKLLNDEENNRKKLAASLIQLGTTLQPR